MLLESMEWMKKMDRTASQSWGMRLYMPPRARIRYKCLQATSGFKLRCVYFPTLESFIARLPMDGIHDPWYVSIMGSSAGSFIG